MTYKFDTITSHLQVMGFVFPGSDVYGGLANSWDYGPLGSLVKNNVKSFWIKKFVTETDTNVLIDPAIIMNPKVWMATGHVANFSDPLVDCKYCKTRFRADKLIEQTLPDVDVNGLTKEQLNELVTSKKVVCPVCGKTEFTPIRDFQLMFKTSIGVTSDKLSDVYLRPETAQGIFVNFKNVVRTTRRKLPIGICDIGKCFRNEITPGNFTFRTREFEQMEMEFFCKPGEDLKWFNYWKDYCLKFVELLKIKPENLRYRDHEKEELAFYSIATTDIEYQFPFGWGELMGVASRTDYDLKRHQEYSKQSLEYLDPDTNEKYIAHCVEPSFGLDRLALALLCDAYDEEKLEGDDTRVVMHIHPDIAPYKACILPLSKKLSEKAIDIYHNLQKHFVVTYDEAGSIGKRYRRQDQIGTPMCITIDFDTLEKGTVTIRDRDTMKQDVVAIENIVEYMNKKINE